MKNLNEQKKLVEEIIKKIDELKPFTYEEVANQTDPYITKCYPLYYDKFAYKGTKKNEYFIECIENDDVDKLNKEELYTFILEHIESIIK